MIFFPFHFPDGHRSLGCGQNVFMSMPPASIRVPSQLLLAPSVTSVPSKFVDNEVKLRALHISPIFYRRGNPWKTSARRLSEGWVTSHHLKWCPYVDTKSVGSHKSWGRKACNHVVDITISLWYFWFLG